MTAHEQAIRPTKRPWTVEHRISEARITGDSDSIDICQVDCSYEGDAALVAHADADLIVMAVNLHDALVAERDARAEDAADASENYLRAVADRDAAQRDAAKFRKSWNVTREALDRAESARDAAVEALRESYRLAVNGDDHRIGDPLARLDAIEAVIRGVLARLEETP